MKRFRHHLLDQTFCKYTAFGVLNLLVCTGLMYVLYHITTLDSWACALVNHTLGGIFSYFFNKRYVFEDSARGWKRPAEFALSLTVCYLIAYSVALPGVKRILQHWPQANQDRLGMGIGVALFVCLNYFSQRYIVFRKRRNKEDGA